MSIEPGRQRGRPHETIRLGFMPLVDAAIPVAAARRGFAAREGLELLLVRETSWANVRDRLAIGHFDAAHLLAPLPIAAALGLTPHDAALIAPMGLGRGGNAVTVSREVWLECMSIIGSIDPADAKRSGLALQAVIQARQERGARPLTFAVVHPYSSHHYELRYWLAASGIDPDRDVALTIVSPPYMSDALESGRIDGFCVGEPWNTRAVRAGHGAILVTKQAIWPDSPDKVLGLRADWASANPDLVKALIRALIAAAAWCAEQANSAELADILSEPDILGVPPADLAPALAGRVLQPDGLALEHPGLIRFDGRGMNRPDQAAAFWYVSQMLRWKQTIRRPGDLAAIEACFDPVIFDAVTGQAAPGEAHRFFDGERFDPVRFPAI
jgi:NitT/TauT family transport system ATP-binding protein